MFQLIKVCPFSRIPVSNSIITDNYFQYNITYNGNNYTIRLSLIEGWEDGRILQPSEQMPMDGMLFNNEWPFEKETVITPDLIRQLMRFGDFPKSFNDKINYYLWKCILRKADEHNEIPFDVTKV